MRSKNAHYRTLVLVLLIPSLVASFISISSAQGLDQDPGHKEYLTINGLKFSSPNDFETKRRKTTERLIYVPHEEYDLGLFVALPEKGVSEEYLGDLSKLLASYLFPKEKATFAWKRLNEYQKVSKFEVGGGMIQGFNGKRRVFVQFRQLKVNDVEALVGYTFALPRGPESRSLFEQNLGGDSMPGWFAQAHIIASITGEPYKALNPGTELITAPLLPKP